ncbi:unnamed protein product [Paramecium sonneborni]|uniref:Uncharacterized protein n=1 Tax=Paramecium sonneborni TaxID=65129 RepID=A0A8S1RTR7_9CILI|nr:unnamed protein product [Paramecium sonneborni]
MVEVSCFQSRLMDLFINTQITQQMYKLLNYINNNEDTIISNQAKWMDLSINNHRSQGCSFLVKLNENQNKVISDGWDQLILIIEYSEHNKKWTVIQNIKVDCQGLILCFINNNLFTFQPYKGNLMHVYELNNGSKQFTKTNHIALVQNIFRYVIQNQNNYLKTKNYELKVEQSIKFGSQVLFGQMSDDGEYLITWDNSSQEIRKYTEK